MKARVKATGEIIEVIPYSGFYDYDYYDPETKLPWLKSELSFDVTDSETDYWTRLEHQYAGMAMQGILACEEWKISPREGVSFAGEVALQAQEIAHALVEKMKQEREG